MTEDKIVVNVAFNISNPLHDQIINASLEIKDKYGSDWYVDDQRYYLHLAMYLFAAPPENREKIVMVAREYGEKIKPLEITSLGLNLSSSGLVMIDFELTPQIYKYHKIALELFNPLREGRQRDKYEDPEKLKKLSPDDLRKIQEYGHIFVLERFSPHVTISRFENPRLGKEVVTKYSTEFKGKTAILSRLQVHEAIFGTEDKTELLCDIPISRR